MQDSSAHDVVVVETGLSAYWLGILPPQTVGEFEQAIMFLTWVGIE